MREYFRAGGLKFGRKPPRLPSAARDGAGAHMPQTTSNAAKLQQILGDEIQDHQIVSKPTTSDIHEAKKPPTSSPGDGMDNIGFEKED